jgi:hypothetical protein
MGRLSPNTIKFGLEATLAKLLNAAPISNDATLHLAAAPKDLKALGIGKEIEYQSAI